VQSKAVGVWARLSDEELLDASRREPATYPMSRGSSIQLGLSLIWTEARRRGLGLDQVVEWMATKPAERVGLPAKGKLALGYDADLAVFAADQAFVVDAAKLHHKNPLTPYQGKTLSGVVRRTFVRGREVDYSEPHGQLLRRGQV